MVWAWLVINNNYSLTKDMTGKEDQYRGSAIRALCVITDVRFKINLLLECNISSSQNTMVQAIERYMKQAIVDRNPSVSSAALVSALVSPSIILYVIYYSVVCGENFVDFTLIFCCSVAKLKSLKFCIFIAMCCRSQAISEHF